MRKWGRKSEKKREREGEKARKESEVEYWQLAVGTSWQLVPVRLKLGWMEPKDWGLGYKTEIENRNQGGEGEATSWP